MARAYCLTLNNPTTVEETRWREAEVHVRYLIFQEERGENGTKHYQGYVELHKPQRISGIKRIFGRRVHAEARKGTRDEAREYCRKEESRVNGPWELGVWNKSGQGCRSDVSALRELVKSGASDIEIVEKLPNEWFRFHRAVDKLRIQYQCRDNGERDIHNELYWGDAGTGKSRKARDENPDAFPLTTKWFDGYSGQKVVIIDDFRGWIPPSTLKHILDRYAYYPEKKGGFVKAMWEKVIITSNHTIRSWWPGATTLTEADYKAIERRIETVIHFNTNFN